MNKTGLSVAHILIILNIFSPKVDKSEGSNMKSMYPTVFFNNMMILTECEQHTQIWWFPPKSEDTGVDPNKQLMYPTVFFNNMMISTDYEQSM